MLNKKDLIIETTKGQGPGGQHKNKTDSTVKITHIPTGIVVVVNGRKQGQNKKKALKEIENRLAELNQEEKAKKKKERRDHAIKNEERIRTYDYSRGLVTDHRTGKTATIKDVVGKGKLDLLR